MGTKKRIVSVLPEDASLSVVDFVVKHFDMTPADALALIARGALSVAGRRASSGDCLSVGQKVVARFSGASVDTPEIVAAERGYWIVNKPQGMPSEPAKDGQLALTTWLENETGRRVHALGRLDKQAFGLMLCVDRGSPAQSTIGDVSRHYYALTRTAPAQPGRWTDWLVKARGMKMVRATQSAPGAVFAAGKFSLVRAGANAALIEVNLETGRFHQIRAQLSLRGCPILGDDRYGGAPGHLALCAYRLRFVDAASGTVVDQTLPLPPMFLALLDA